mmetsp:Transcript_17849/g.39347  ORF Transcript_17849/g.39347 Transcript_17849/m.39347 type:complete len:353 (+) Transcript_17849:51-1109(+)
MLRVLRARSRKPLWAGFRAVSSKASTATDVKVSERGSADALFRECLDTLRKQRLENNPDVHTRPSPLIEKLTLDEVDVLREAFHRVDRSEKMSPTQQSKGEELAGIDPYWNPFHSLSDTQESVIAEFDEYSKMASAAEAKRLRISIRRSLKRVPSLADPFTYDFKRSREKDPKQYGGGSQTPAQPRPHKMNDAFWDRTPLQERILREDRIRWTDVDILRQMVAENGYILPRRTTMLSKRKQLQLVKAIRNAQQMALIPWDWKPQDFTVMPLMDPLQFLVERLTDRYLDHRDLRSQAMLKVMIRRYPELKYRRFLKGMAQRNKDKAEASRQSTEEAQGDFSRILSRYRGSTPA